MKNICTGKTGVTYKIQIVLSILIELSIIVFLFIGVADGFNGTLNLLTFIPFILNVFSAPKLALSKYILDFAESVLLVALVIKIIINLVHEIRTYLKHCKAGTADSTIKSNLFRPAKNIVLFALFVLICNELSAPRIFRSDLSTSPLNGTAKISLIVIFSLFAGLVLFDSASNKEYSLSEKIIFTIFKFGFILLGALFFSIMPLLTSLHSSYKLLRVVFSSSIRLSVITMFGINVLTFVTEIILIKKFYDIFANISFIFEKKFSRIDIGSFKTVIIISLISIVSTFPYIFYAFVEYGSYDFAELMTKIYILLKLSLSFFVIGLTGNLLLKNEG